MHVYSMRQNKLLAVQIVWFRLLCHCRSTVRTNLLQNALDDVVQFLAFKKTIIFTLEALKRWSRTRLTYKLAYLHATYFQQIVKIVYRAVQNSE